MTDLNQQSAAPAENVNTPSTQPTTTLEDIAREFPIEEQARNFTAQPQQYQQFQQPKQQVYEPDPVIDPEGYKMWRSQQNQEYTQLRSTVSEVANNLAGLQRHMEQQRLDADVDQAVSHVNAKLKVDPQLAEAALQVEYSRNPTFQRIWDNRGKNPQAFKKALDVLSDKLSNLFQVRQDPQLANNVRAAQLSQRTMATTKNPGVNEGVPDDPQEFDKWWRSQIRG